METVDVSQWRASKPRRRFALLVKRTAKLRVELAESEKRIAEMSRAHAELYGKEVDYADVA